LKAEKFGQNDASIILPVLILPCWSWHVRVAKTNIEFNPAQKQFFLSGAKKNICLSAAARL
jgi:hypothetical protein